MTNFTRQRPPALRYIRRSTNLFSRWNDGPWNKASQSKPWNLARTWLVRRPNEVKDHEKVITLFYPGGHTEKRQLEGGGSRWRCRQRSELSSPTPRVSWSHQSWKYKEGFSTRPKGCWLTAWFQTSRLQNCERMCLFCFKPPCCSDLLEQPQETWSAIICVIDTQSTTIENWNDFKAGLTHNKMLYSYLTKAAKG